MEHEELLPLLLRVAKDDSEAFELLYSKTKRQLYALALQMLRSKESAEEALQEAFVSIWYKADQYREGHGTVYTWMVSIVRYRALDMIRYKKVRRNEIQNESSSIDDYVDPIAQVDGNNTSSHYKIENCMQELDLQQRQAIHLAYFNGMSHSEVVDHLGSPLGTIKSWIRRGLVSLQRCLSL